jgi:uncharacterized RDD family membrane protein YckC
MEPAGHGQRILALIIDMLLLGLIVGIGGVIMFVLGESLGTTGLIVLFVVICIPLVVYEPYFIAAKGATPGKSAMGLRVVGKDGGPVTAGQSIARFLLKNILNQLFIPIFVPLFTERRQGLHEMITSTYLVRS